MYSAKCFGNALNAVNSTIALIDKINDKFKYDNKGIMILLFSAIKKFIYFFFLFQAMTYDAQLLLFGFFSLFTIQIELVHSSIYFGHTHCILQCAMFELLSFVLSFFSIKWVEWKWIYFLFYNFSSVSVFLKPFSLILSTASLNNIHFTFLFFVFSFIWFFSFLFYLSIARVNFEIINIIYGSILKIPFYLLLQK